MPALFDRRAWFPLLIAVLSLASWAALSGSSPGGQATAAAQALTVSETVLARLDQHADLESLETDRRTVRRVVWVSKDGRSERVFVDGMPGPVFDKVELNADTFSPDSTRVAYWGKRDKWYAVVDGKEYGPYAMQRRIIFSGDSRTAVWHGCSSSWSGKCVRVTNGVEGDPVEPTAEDVFSREGSTLAFRELTKEGNRRVARVVVNGEKGPPFKAVGRPHLSADGRHVAYWAQRDDEKVMRLIVDGTAVQGVEGRSSDLYALDRLLSFYDLPFAPDERRLAFVIERNDKLIPVIHGKSGPASDWFGWLAFDASFGRSAYVVTSTGGFLKALRMMGGLNPVDLRTADTRLVLDGVERPDIGRPKGPPVFSPDGKRLAVPLEQTVVVDEQAGALYDGVAPSSINFSPDSRHVAYAVEQRKKWRVVVDGVAGPAYKAVGGVWEFGQRALAFTPDSRQVIYKAEVDGGWVLVVDPGGTSPAYDEISNVIAFEAPGTATVIARRGTDLLRVVVSLPAKVE